MKKVAVLVSGKGTNLEAMINAEVPIALVVADRPCRGLEIAKKAMIETALVERESFGKDFDRDAYTKKLLDVLVSKEIDLIAMAGFMTFLGDAIFDRYDGHILNTHPSLLPLFKGDKAVEDALKAGSHVTGCTIHIATKKLDDVPIIAQHEVKIRPKDTVETLHERIKKIERVVYPETIKKILAGEIKLPHEH